MEHNNVIIDRIPGDLPLVNAPFEFKDSLELKKKFDSYYKSISSQKGSSNPV
jgi:hypothetical protein